MSSSAQEPDLNAVVQLSREHALPQRSRVVRRRAEVGPASAAQRARTRPLPSSEDEVLCGQLAKKARLSRPQPSEATAPVASAGAPSGPAAASGVAAGTGKRPAETPAPAPQPRRVVKLDRSRLNANSKTS
eukprot:tig00021017_g17186.t1